MLLTVDANRSIPEVYQDVREGLGLPDPPH
jgi:hypothetical protein